jgi:hypothetical protein
VRPAWKRSSLQKGTLADGPSGIRTSGLPRNRRYHSQPSRWTSCPSRRRRDGNALARRDHEFESLLLQRRVNCEPEFRAPFGPVENHAFAVTFDDFLDHGADYLKHNRKDQVAIIAGIVFEDTIRRICRVLEILVKEITMETPISELADRDVLTALKAKRARAAAGLRTSAAHARWEEIDRGGLAPVIELMKQLIGARLA